MVGGDFELDRYLVLQANQVYRMRLHCILGQPKEVHVAGDDVERSLLVDARCQRDRGDAALELSLDLLGCSQQQFLEAVGVAVDEVADLFYGYWLDRGANPDGEAFVDAGDLAFDLLQVFVDGAATSFLPHGLYQVRL